MGQNVPIMDYVYKLESQLKEAKKQVGYWQMYCIKSAILGLCQPWLALIVGMLIGGCVVRLIYAIFK